jgi:hypothetical protein
MMFGDEDNVFDPRGLGGPHPLLGICLSRIKDGRIGGAVSPFAVHKCVWTEMNDRADFQILPGDLLRTRLHIGEVLRQRRRRAQRDKSENRSASAKYHLPSPIDAIESEASSTLLAHMLVVRQVAQQTHQLRNLLFK